MPPIQTCFTCDNVIGAGCTCSVCRECSDRVFAEDLCPSCHGCFNGCCECILCADDDCGNRFSAELMCGNCMKCRAHCTCYRCNNCHIFVEPNNRRNGFCTRCHNCTEHCVCYRCRNCQSTGNRNSRCPNCERCLAKCCKCSVCTACSSNVQELHSCGFCGRCCGCNTAGLRFRSGTFKFHNSLFGKGEFKVNKLRRHLAVELEVDRYTGSIASKNLAFAVNSWSDPVVRDGSIGDSGFEITTNPTNGDLFIKHIHQITSGLKDIGARCTDACGMHVHVNVKGDIILDKKTKKPVLDKNGAYTFDNRSAYSQYDLQRLAKLYKLVEMAMFSLCDERRITSRFSTVCGDYWCGVSSDKKKFREDLISKMYFSGNRLNTEKNQVNRQFGGYRAMGQSIKHKKNHKYEQVRYKALNIHSYFMRGTIEFRHHQGSVDAAQIINWALVCGNVVDAASRLTDKEVQALPNDPYQALLAILPETLHEYCTSMWNKNKGTGWNRYDMIKKDKFAGVPVPAPAQPIHDPIGPIPIPNNLSTADALLTSSEIELRDLTPASFGRQFNYISSDGTTFNAPAEEILRLYHEYRSNLESIVAGYRAARAAR